VCLIRCGVRILVYLGLILVMVCFYSCEVLISLVVMISWGGLCDIVDLG